MAAHRIGDSFGSACPAARSCVKSFCETLTGGSCCSRHFFRGHPEGSFIYGNEGSSGIEGPNRALRCGH